MLGMIGFDPVQPVFYEFRDEIISAHQMRVRVDRDRADPLQFGYCVFSAYVVMCDIARALVPYETFKCLLDRRDVTLFLKPACTSST